MASTVTASTSNNQLRKWASLLVLIFFTSGTSIVSQRSRVHGSTGATYSIATSIFLSELFKLLLGLGLAMWAKASEPAPSIDNASLPLFSEKGEALDRDQRAAATSSLDDRLDAPSSPSSHVALSLSPSMVHHARQVFNEVYCPAAWMMGVPALVYVLQNMLQLGANSHLSSVAYQGLSQLKLITAALISSYLFRTTLLSRQQWLCLPLLLTGVVFLIQKPNASHEAYDAAAAATADSPFAHPVGSKASALVGQAAAMARTYASAQLASGIMLMVLACICGSYAGVYIETRLKSSMNVPLSIRNAQLATFSMMTAAVAVLLDAITVGTWAPLRNFSTLAWCTVVLRGLAGYVVSATLRYADTIMKGFATSTAIITTIIIESLLTSQLPSFSQFFGSVLVLSSTYCYVVFGAARKS